MRRNIGPFSIGIAHTRTALRLIGAEIMAIIKAGTFQLNVNCLVLGTGFGLRIERDPHSPILLDIFVSLLSIPVALGAEIGRYPERPAASDLDAILANIFQPGAGACVDDGTGKCATHDGSPFSPAGAAGGELGAVPGLYGSLAEFDAAEPSPARPNPRSNYDDGDGWR